MITAETTSWLQAVPVILVAALVVFAPGTVAVRLLGFPARVAACVGPAVTISTLTIAGVLLGAAGWAWSLPTQALTLGGLLALCAGLGRFLPSAARDDGHGGPTALWELGGVALAALLVFVAVMPATGSPDAFPQHPDTIFHLGTSMTMLEHRDISTIHAVDFVFPGDTGFYPAAFHAVAVTVSMLTGASVAVTCSVTALVVAALIWPAGLVLLGTTVFGRRPAVILGAAVSSVAFSAFPYWLMGYGVLWPNLLGQGLLPSLLAMFIAAVAGRRRWLSLLVLVAGLPGIVAAHPNALIALGLFGGTALAFALLRGAWSQRERPARALALTLVTVVGVALAAAVWAAATSRADKIREANPPGPEMGAGEALVDVLFHGPRGAVPLWVAGAVVLVGVAVILARHRQQWWVVGVLVLVGTLYFLICAVDTWWTRLATWPWYTNAPRLAALLVLPAALACTAALDYSASLLSAARRPAWGRSAAAVAVTGLFVVTTGAANTSAHEQIMRPYFHANPATSWATPAELRALRKLGELVPRDATVAANPWKGGNFLYLVSGRRALFPSEKALIPGDRTLLGNRLDEAGSSPEVCAAARRQHVSFAITGGKPASGGFNRLRPYAGVDAVGTSDAFTEVAREGGYVLYRLDECAG